jgi:hypothetical protein
MAPILCFFPFVTDARQHGQAGIFCEVCIGQREFTPNKNRAAVGLDGARVPASSAETRVRIFRQWAGGISHLYQFIRSRRAFLERVTIKDGQISYEQFRYEPSSY